MVIFKNLKQNASRLAIFAIVGATLMSFSEKKEKEEVKAATKSFTEVTLFFHGVATDQSEVENPANWSEDSKGQSCNPGTVLPCSMNVDESALAPGNPGERVLDPSKITIQAASTSAGYVPDPINSSGAPFTPNNRN